ncbi:MAG: extracellular solute-binding protein [Euzebyales bacterium]|nr:extracellular solute-binding protein [Euzebyales bacterium]
MVDAVLTAYRAAEPDVAVEVFRAPTGELTARVAAEQRSGGIRADLLLLSDPLSMQQYAAQGLLREWRPPDASVVAAEAHTDTFWGVSTIDVVVVHRPGGGLDSWSDLTNPRYRDRVALPNPGFAGSALGALGFFALADGYGLDFYRQLEENGAVQVKSPTEVITGVAEGRFDAGMALDFSARSVIAQGAPVEISAPEPGAVRIYAPVAIIDSTTNLAAAESLAGFLFTREAQQELSRLGRNPVRDDVTPPSRPERVVTPDWPEVFDRQQELLEDYRDIFGG